MTNDELTAIETRLRLITGEHWRRMHENQIEAILPQPDGTDRTPLVAAANFVYNADFIARAPDDMRALIAEVKQLRTVARVAAKALDALHEGNVLGADKLLWYIVNHPEMLQAEAERDERNADAARPAPDGGANAERGEGE